MKKFLPIVFLLFAAFACAMPGTAAKPSLQPTITQPVLPTPVHATQIPGPTATQQTTSVPETVSTVQPSSTSSTASPVAPSPSHANSLGSPFSPSCGSGIPQIWRNASFNGEMPFDYAASADDQHGSVTFYPPQGCDVSAFNGEVVAPADGTLQQFGENGYIILLPQKTYPAGLVDALKFVGIQNPDLARVASIQLQLGSYLVSSGVSGPVKKGQSIGDISVSGSTPPQLEYQVIVNYDTGDGVHSYIVSPTLFQYDGKPWPCVQGSPYSCEPKANNFK